MSTQLATRGRSYTLDQALVHVTSIGADEQRRVEDYAREHGKSLDAAMIDLGCATRADALEAMNLALMVPTAARLADLPPWDTLIVAGEDSQAGAACAALIGNSGERRKRAFLLVASDAEPKSVGGAVVSLTSRGVRAGWHVAGKMTVSRGFIATVIAESAKRSPTEALQGLSSEQQEFDRICLDAFRQGASDIHLTVLDGNGFIAYRLDGELEHVEDRPADYVTSVAAAAYNTLTETGSTKTDFNPRAYQDASIERQLEVGLIRFRFSSLPLAPSGFDVTLRIIPIGVDQGKRDTRALGYSRDQNEKLERAFSNSSGMLIWVGTTGSGKSTSMAAYLEQLAADNPGRKIRTVEEPVEARIRGAYQTPVLKNADGSNFKAVLGQLMRADPDVLMIGEIRDDATADLAIQAVRTGHLCVSTLHCQGAPGVYDRMSGMGVPRSDLATVGLFLGFVFQVLVQRLCDHCKTPINTWAERNPDHQVLERLARLTGGNVAGIHFESDEGCQHCRYKGRTGRTACAEILTPTPEICKAVMACDSAEVWRLWRSEINAEDPADMSGRTAFEHGLYKMKQGMVSPLAIERAFRFVDEPAFPGAKEELA